MAKKRRDDGRRVPITDALGNRRAPVVKLKQVGDEVIHGQKSSNTVSDLQIDYPVLLDEVQQVEQYISIKMRRRSCKPTAEEVIKAFCGKAPFLLGDATTPGYATHKDIEELIESSKSNFDFTRDLMAKGWNLKRNTIDSSLKPGRRKKS
jgi:hypothetical protein